jgi:hypothetical protein
MQEIAACKRDAETGRDQRHKTFASEDEGIGDRREKVRPLQ